MADSKDESTDAAPRPGSPPTDSTPAPTTDPMWTLGNEPPPPTSPTVTASGTGPIVAEPPTPRAEPPTVSVPPPPPPPRRPAPRRRPLWRRLLRSLSVFLGIVLLLAVVAGAYLINAAVTGQNLPILRALVSGFGRVVAGQHTEQLQLQVRVRPSARELSGVATLQMRATDARRQLYFLLNDALAVRRVWMERADGTQSDVPFYRVWMFIVVQLPQPIAADQAVRIGMEYGGHPTGGRFGSGTAIIEPDDVLLSTYDIWYPTDLQSFFTADVEATVPAHLNVVHNGDEQSREKRGDALVVHWTTPRPVPALALVAGRYREFNRSATRHYRAELPNDVALDDDRLLSSLASADATLTDRYGDSGFTQITLLVHRGLDFAFNDGSGLIVMTPRYFRRGDYGYSAIAHEVAHNWWGGTVAEKWLQPGTGGEWVVEGFAEFSSLIAEREELGQPALVRRLQAEFYDPTTAGVLSDMSVLDNGLDPNARATIYNKGAYVTFMLAELMGEDAFFTAAREFIDKFRYQQVASSDIETVFAPHSPTDLGAFFTAWVRSKAYLDLALEPQEGNAAANNLGTAPPPGNVTVWRFPNEGAPESETVTPGATTALGSATRLVLDPSLATADMFRDNNVLPRWPNPRAVARSARGELLVAYGERYPWSPARVTQMGANGQAVRSWDFDHGIDGDPWWSADGTRILVRQKDETGTVGLTALNATDGTQRLLGPAAGATAAADWVVVARGDRLVQIKGATETTLVQRRGAVMQSPVSAPDGTQIAYVAAHARDMDLRVTDASGAHDRLLLTWESGDVNWVWAPDGSRLFAVLPGDWDWKLLEIPLQGAPRVLVKEAASIPDLAVANDGTRLAFVAAPSIDYGAEHREVFVVQRNATVVQRVHLADANPHRLAWLDDESLLVIVSDPTTTAVPAHRELRRLTLADQTLHAFP